MMTKTFPPALKRLRAKRNLSLQALADLCGVSKNRIWQIESGRKPNVTLIVLERLCAALDCTPNDLLCGATDAH